MGFVAHQQRLASFTCTQHSCMRVQPARSSACRLIKFQKNPPPSIRRRFQGLCQEIGCHIVEADVLMHAQGVITWDCSCICSPTCPC